MENKHQKTMTNNSKTCKREKTTTTIIGVMPVIISPIPPNFQIQNLKYIPHLPPLRRIKPCKIIEPQKKIEPRKNITSISLTKSIKVKIPRQLVRRRLLGNYYEQFAISPSMQTLRNDNENGLLKRIKKLYKTYFSLPIQINIIILANIFHLTNLANKYYTLKNSGLYPNFIDEQTHKIDRNHQNRLCVLESVANKKFEHIMSSLKNKDFDGLFQMFIIAMYRLLNSTETENNENKFHFENLTTLILNSYKSTGIQNIRYISEIDNLLFHYQCIEMLSVIETCQKFDCHFKEDLTLFNTSLSESRSFFSNAIKFVQNDYNVKLESILNVCCNTYIASRSPDPIDRPVKICSNLNEFTKKPIARLVILPLNYYGLCYASNCKNPSTIFCSNCVTNRYCSHECRKLHWVKEHSEDCDKKRRAKILIE